MTGFEDVVTEPDPSVAARSAQAAGEIVSLARSLGPKGFVRLNNLIRSALMERIPDVETRILRDEKFGRPDAAQRARDYLEFYVKLIRLTDLFIAATCDESGLDRLGIAFGGAAAGHIHVPAGVIREVVDSFDSARDDDRLVGADPGRMLRAIESLKLAAADPEMVALY